jgi:hypothetical protein
MVERSRINGREWKGGHRNNLRDTSPLDMPNTYILDTNCNRSASVNEIWELEIVVTSD